MKNPTIATLCLLLFTGGWAFGQIEQRSFGGTTWKALSESARRTYALGFAHGYQWGLWHGWAAATAKVTVDLSPLVSSQENADEGAREAQQVASAFKHATTGSHEATISAFYNDYRNAPVCLDVAATFAAMSLAGNPPTEQQLGLARKAGAQFGCQ